MSFAQRRYVNRPDNITKKLPTLERLLDGIDVAGAARALEVGCGPGYFSAALSELHDLEVVGTDLDEREVRFAREHSAGDRVEFVQADVTRLPFPDADFDIVLSMMVLHHIRDWKDALGEISRVLRPGGYYLFHDITYSRLLKRAGPLLRGHAFYSIEEIKSRVEELGMRQVHELPEHRYFFEQFTEYNVAFQKSGSRSA